MERDDTQMTEVSAAPSASAWQRTEQIISSIQNKRQCVKAIKDLVSAYAEAGLWQQVEQIISSIKDEWKSEVLVALASAYALAGQWSEAETTIFTIQEEEWKATALADLAVVYTQKGQLLKAKQVWQQAEQSVASMRNVWQRDEALVYLASAYIRAKFWSQAEATIASTTYEDIRTKTLISLAEAFAKHNEYEQLLHLVHRYWLQATTRHEAIKWFPLALSFISRYPNIGADFYNAFAWVDNFLLE